MCLLLILFIPNLFVWLNFKEIHGSISMMVGYLALAALLWLIPLVFLPKKIYFGIAFVFLLLSPLEIIFVRNLGVPMTEGFVEAVFMTYYGEAMEQINSNLPIIILCFLLAALYVFLFFRIQNTFLPRKIRIGIAALFLLFNGILFIQMVRIQPGENISTSFRLKTAFQSTYLKYYSVYPANLIIHTQRNISNQQKNKKLRKNIDAFSFNATSENPENEEEIYVLIIGESARYQNFGINGYDRNTTPNLDTIRNLIPFSDVSAVANVTSYSIPMIITRETQDDRTISEKEKSVLDAFREAGFRTSWFANQNSDYPVVRRLRGVTDDFIANQFDVKIKGFYDADILPQFREILNKKDRKKLFVIHTLGSHFRYTNRYPEAFEVFKPAMKESGYNDLKASNREEIVNSYDNSIRYTDYFLSEMIATLKETKKNAVLIYLSDHGQNFFETEDKIFGHGTLKPTEYEYHIPYFVWTSNSYKAEFPEKIKALRENKDKPSGVNHTFYTLLDLANIDFKDGQQKSIFSLASPEYETPKQRFVLNSAGEAIQIK